MAPDLRLFTAEAPRTPRLRSAAVAATKVSAFLHALRGSLPFPPQRAWRCLLAATKVSAFLRALRG
jgi:hypothetical protein